MSNSGFQGPLVDSLSRRAPMPGEVRAFQTKKQVGIFYFLWIDLPNVNDVSKILAAHPDAMKDGSCPPWGDFNEYHFWGEPLYGYYRSHDPWVIRRHAYLLADAGIDFLVLDATNAVTYEKVYLTLCKVFDELREEGTKVPKITFMLNTKAGETARKIYDKLYKPGLYPELWFRWQGKPLLVCDPTEVDGELKEFFTFRKAHWPFTLVDTKNEWHWEATYPQVYSYDESPLQPEEVNVSVGQNLHWKTGNVTWMSVGGGRGRSFCDGHQSQGPNEYLHGYNFQEQWSRAMELDPKIVFVTGWNEWVAMQLEEDRKKRPGFCDQFSPEFSRDVEMMRGGYGDNYYCQMVSHIRQFKGMPAEAPPCPALQGQTPTLGAKSLNVFWNLASRSYTDHAFETIPRDHPGCGKFHYKEKSGRNDFRELKVAHDAEWVYFMAETRAPIVGQGEVNWMTLMLKVASETPHEFLVNRIAPDGRRAAVERKTKDGQWKPIGTAELRVAGDRLLLAVSREKLGVGESDFTIDFKWFDNLDSTGEAMDVYIKGDVAPESRFFYRYRGVKY